MQGAPVNTADFAHLQRLMAAQGQTVTATSLGDALAANGLRMGTVHCGTPGAAFLINHAAAAHGHTTFSVYGEDATQTPEAVRDVVARIGPLPAEAAPKFDTLRYAARAFCDTVLARTVRRSRCCGCRSPTPAITVSGSGRMRPMP